MALPKVVGEDAINVLVTEIKKAQSSITTIQQSVGSSIIIDTEGYVGIDYDRVEELKI